VKFAFIGAEKAFPVVVMCDVLSVSRSGYYAWARREPSLRAKRDEALKAAITDSHRRSRGTYGSPRVHRDLLAAGQRVGKKRVERIMRTEGLAAKRRRRFRRTTDSNHALSVAPNVLARSFSVPAPNRAWVTDVTYVWTLEGWLFLAAILDLCSRRVVGWATSATNDRALALTALRAALEARRVAPGIVHHSDRGSPYASAEYRHELDSRGFVASMSRKGNCWDNAVAESFFATLKGEHLDHQVLFTREQAHRSIADFIENFYNLHRRHSSIEYLSPVEYELRLQSRRDAA